MPAENLKEMFELVPFRDEIDDFDYSEEHVELISEIKEYSFGLDDAELLEEEILATSRVEYYQPAVTPPPVTPSTIPSTPPATAFPLAHQQSNRPVRPLQSAGTTAVKKPATTARSDTPGIVKAGPRTDKARKGIETKPFQTAKKSARKASPQATQRPTVPASVAKLKPRPPASKASKRNVAATPRALK